MSTDPSGSMTRRQWLAAAGEAALAAPLTVGGLAGEAPGALAAPGPGGASNADLAAKAKKNLKLAVFTGVYAHLKLEDAARRIQEDGFSGVVLEFTFSDVRFDWRSPDWEAAKKIVEAFGKRKIGIAGLFAYYNVIDPDAERRKLGEGRMEFLLTNSRRLGSPVVCTETGTMNRQSEWLGSPENSTEETFNLCAAAFRKLAKTAEKSGAVVAIEPYWKNVIGSAERAERLFRSVPSPSLKLVMDPCNYYRKEDLPAMQAILEEIFLRVGVQTVLAHAKDVKASADGTDLPAAGLGVLDYPLYLRLLAKLDKELFFAVEHLAIDDVPRARDFVKGQLGKI